MLARGINFGKLLVGGLLAFAVSATLLLLVAPLVAARVTGGTSYQIEDSSMAPTLLVGDWVLAEELPEGQVPPRGAIVGYPSPLEQGAYDVRRVIGLPGERVQMRGGALFIDGQRVQMTQLDDRVIRRVPPALRKPLPKCINDPVKVFGRCHQERWREVLPGGASEVVLNAHGRIGMFRPGGNATPDDTRIMVVPKGSVFVLGDNRDASTDSRMPDYGMIPIARIHERVWLIHSSIDRSSRLLHPRLSRFFRRVD